MTEERIKTLEIEIQALRETLSLKEDLLRQIKQEKTNSYCSDFLPSEITRYSRQMIMPQISLEGQKTLKNSKILIVGVGGLGCPASLYLVAAGIGTVTLLDYDEVELTNLHRQILHNESLIGVPKVQSALNGLKSLNSNVNVIPMKIHADNTTLSDLIIANKYNVILDCSDNVATRYLLNDISVFHKIPLVSGSALQMEGQLTVYNYKNSVCYRCLFPKPPPPETVTSCGDGGVLGVVPGVIGVLQALETIKILVGIEGVLAGKLLLFDGTDSSFRTVKLRQRNANCEVCGDEPLIQRLVDYEQFCGTKAHDKVIDVNLLQNAENISVTNLKQLISEDSIIIDVRPQLEYEMCKLPKTINIPLTSLISNKETQKINKILKNSGNNIYFLCRRGNDSQRAVKFLQEQFPEFSSKFINVKGGLYAFNKLVDPQFPIY